MNAFTPPMAFGAPAMTELDLLMFVSSYHLKPDALSEDEGAYAAKAYRRGVELASIDSYRCSCLQTLILD